MCLLDSPIARRLRLLPPLLACLTAPAGPAACRSKPDAAEAPAAAIVDGEVIPLAALEAEAATSLRRFQRGTTPLPPSIALRLKESVMGRMIDDVVLAHKAKALGLALDDAQITAQLEAARARFPSPEAFAEHLARTHQTEGAMRQELARNLLQERVVDRLVGEVGVADADVQRYYEENLARFKEPAKIRARRLLLRLPKDATAAQERAKIARAAAWVQRARKRPKGFAELAFTHSEGPEREARGDMGDFFPRGRMSPAFDAAAFELATADEISDPFVSPDGVEVVQLLERRDAHTRPFEEVQAGLRASLTARAHNDRRREVLQQMRQAARIERRVDFDAPAPPAAGSAPAAAPAPPAAPGPGPAPAQAPATPDTPGTSGTAGTSDPSASSDTPTTSEAPATSD